MQRGPCSTFGCWNSGVLSPWQQWWRGNMRVTTFPLLRRVTVDALTGSFARRRLSFCITTCEWLEKHDFVGKGQSRLSTKRDSILRNTTQNGKRGKNVE